MRDNISDITKYLLALIPGAKLVADDRQILCRCPICMDSANISSAHFYIGPMKDDTKPLQYHCKKCNSSSLFTYKTLQLFGIYDADISEMISAHNSMILSSPEWQKAIYREGVVHRVHNIIPEVDGIIEAKIRYINRRIGTNLSLEEMVANKIVLSLNNLLAGNYIHEITRSQSLINDIDTFFIGFLSYDNGYVNMRRLCSEGRLYKTIDKRYLNYNIFNTIDNSMRFYVIPTEIELLDPRPIDIWITEGPFDALSLKYNVYRNRDRCIFISNGGKGYLVTVKFILQYLGLMNIRIHLCPDGDVPDKDMYFIRNMLSAFNLDIYVERNIFKGQKDFGVPASEIELQSYLINTHM